MPKRPDFYCDFYCAARQGFIDGLRKLGHFNPGGGLGCQDVDISLEHFGQSPTTQCGWFLQVKDGKFVVYKRKNGESNWRGTAIRSATQETTTAAPTSGP